MSLPDEKRLQDERIRKCWATMPRAAGIVFRLRMHRNFPYDRIAKRMRISHRKVRRLMDKAIDHVDRVVRLGELDVMSLCDGAWRRDEVARCRPRPVVQPAVITKS